MEDKVAADDYIESWELMTWASVDIYELFLWSLLRFPLRMISVRIVVFFGHCLFIAPSSSRQVDLLKVAVDLRVRESLSGDLVFEPHNLVTHMVAAGSRLAMKETPCRTTVRHGQHKGPKYGHIPLPHPYPPLDSHRESSLRRFFLLGHFIHSRRDSLQTKVSMAV